MAKLREQAEINGQTALSTLSKAPSAIMVTELSDDDVALMGARKAAGLKEALEQARAELAKEGIDAPTCYLMPSAAYTVPFPEEEAARLEILSSHPPRSEAR